jgi:Na+/H+ antiporter NhaD/arsenite permease-like protein
VGIVAGRCRARAALLIGLGLGQNLSVTGSLATILWPLTLRRDRQAVGAGAFQARRRGDAAFPLLAIAGALHLG